MEFSEAEFADLQEACEDCSLPDKIKRKLMCLKMHQQKVRNVAVAKVLNITPNTVTAYLKEYRDGGLAATLEDRSYRPVSCLTPFLDCLRCFFSACPPCDVSEAMMHIIRMTGIVLKETQVRKTLHQMGLSWRKTGVIPGKAGSEISAWYRGFLQRERLGFLVLLDWGAVIRRGGRILR